MDPDETRSERSQRLYEELNNKISEYIGSIYDDDGVFDPQDYISSWSIVAHTGSLKSQRINSYFVEVFPHASAPHVIKGILREGIKTVEDAQYDSEEITPDG